jgi:hypothetical protein
MAGRAALWHAIIAKYGAISLLAAISRTWQDGNHPVLGP